MTIDLLALPWLQFIFGSLFLGICMLLIGIIMLQKGRGGGLSGAFGGAGGHSAFGSKTGDVFTYITIVLAVLYLGAAVANNYVFRELTLTAPGAAVTDGADADADSASGDAGSTDAADTETTDTPAEPVGSTPATPAPTTSTTSPN